MQRAKIKRDIVCRKNSPVDNILRAWPVEVK